MNKILAIVITYNIDSKFKKVVEAIKDQVNEVLVVDNGSNAKSIEVLKSLNNMVNVIELGENKGIAYALNKGIEYGLKNNFHWILTLDHDSIAKADMIKVMLQQYEELDEEDKSKIAMLVPRHVEELKHSNGEVVEEEDVDYEYVLTEITSGALVKADYYNEHRYDDKLFIDLVDHDFCLNINLNGKKVMRCNLAILYHNLGESVEKSILGIKCTCTNHSEVRRYYMTRNRLYIWNKYKDSFPGWVKRDKLRFLSETGKVILFEDNSIKKIKMTCKGVKDYKDNKFGPMML